MTVTATNSISSAFNLDFNLDNFPPPRPSISARRSSPLIRDPMSYDYSSSSSRRPTLQTTTSSSKMYGLPSHPRSPRILEKGIPRSSSRHPRNGLRSTLYGIFGHKSEPDLDIPIQDVSPESSNAHDDVPLPPWPPLHVDKRPGTHHVQCRCSDPKRKKRRRLVILFLIILLLYLLADTIFLNVRVVSLSKVQETLSAAQQLCLTQFTVNAPANASLYPCSTCLGILQDVPASFKFSNTNDAQTLSDSLQFCGLQSLLEASGQTAQNSLTNGGWMQDTDFCTWTGVKCDSGGNVTSLEMVFPAVPSVIPSGIGALTSLQSLQITGGNNLPAGSLPNTFTNLTSLTSLYLESTSLSALPQTLFEKGSELSGLMSLTLVKNNGFGGALPDVSGLALQSFIVDEQELSTPLTSLLNSTAMQNSLTTLSLTSTNLTGSFPSSLSLPALQTLSLANNSALSGSVPESVCTSKNLQSCDLSGTGLTGSETGGGCGPCTF